MGSWRRKDYATISMDKLEAITKMAQIICGSKVFKPAPSLHETNTSDESLEELTNAMDLLLDTVQQVATMWNTVRHRFCDPTAVTEESS
jgi:hypothetical protein